jgi:hypothetical protein
VMAAAETSSVLAKSGMETPGEEKRTRFGLRRVMWWLVDRWRAAYVNRR